jgi:hypothetical protein
MNWLNGSLARAGPCCVRAWTTSRSLGATSTRRYPCIGVGRDEDWAGSDAEAVHRDRYHVSEQLYLAEVDPVRLVDVVIDNSDFDRPRIVLER